MNAVLAAVAGDLLFASSGFLVYANHTHRSLELVVEGDVSPDAIRRLEENGFIRGEGYGKNASWERGLTTAAIAIARLILEVS